MILTKLSWNTLNNGCLRVIRGSSKKNLSKDNVEARVMRELLPETVFADEVSFGNIVKLLG